ncbi:phosphate/phosphite/phosphonate ABC transporter substrate-binding protein [Solirubrum puertoriconensis]|uniref:Phosphate/phosphite/phosphonate ABC transporter substrate-binding protein n=1 Tax=Solirubrum puertoriconensis TaxID=1751427 RepID=A0A9X0HJS5_SOLP1|nr:phosphate/phosphite/phosphonate ABC transporter substrate-binding protein [Solirubrum puertoriconensis]KUG07215.1 hypothetical protein ASU33_12640 [Solirubrum puertoriconensis]
MKTLLALFAVVLLLAAPAFAQPYKAPAAAPLVVATYAYGGNDRVANISPLAEELAQKLGRKAQVKSYPTVPALLQAVRAGQVDVALLNTLGYLLLDAEAKAAVVPLAMLQQPTGGSGNYQACLVAHQRSGVSSLADLTSNAGKLRLAFAGEHSTSGHVVQRLQLSALGIGEPESSFAAISYSGNHAAVLQDVLQGRADLGACGLGEYLRLQQQGAAQELRLLWASEDIPLGPVVARPSLGSIQLRRLQEALLALHETNLNALAQVRAAWAEAKHAERFVPVQAGAYRSLYQIADSQDQRMHNLPGQADELRRILAHYGQ